MSPIEQYNEAVETNNKLLQKVLLQHIDKEQALIGACINNNMKIFKNLIENGADVRFKNDYLVLVATNENNLEFVKLLLDLGCDFNGPGNFSFSIAARYNYVDILKLFLKKGLTNKEEYEIARDWAIIMGYKEVMRLLKEHIWEES